MHLLVIGNVAFDTICKVKFLPKKNEATSIVNLKECFGGCAGNAACVAGKLGVKCSLYASVGLDFKNSGYERRLKELGIDISLLTYRNKLTARSFMFADDRGNQQIYYYPGASLHLIHRPVDFSKFTHVHFTAGEISTYRALMEKAREHGCIVSFDPGQEMFHRSIEREIYECLSLSHYLFFNEYEIKHLLDGIGSQNAEELFFDDTIAIVVSKGERGSTVYRRDGRTVDIPAVKTVSIKDPTGAGDSHRAGFIVGIMKGYDEEVACRIGSVVAHFVIQEMGAQENLPSWDEVIETYKRTYGELNTLI